MAELPSESISQDLNVSLERGSPPSVENSPVFDSRFSESSRDEFWDALSSNYDYLMDDGLIATCKETRSDLSLEEDGDGAGGEENWCFGRFVEQFKWLHDLLHNLQVAKEGDSKEKSQKILDEHEHIAYLCQLFNDQAEKLCSRHPDMRDEVNRRLNLLNNKWKAVIQHSDIKSPSRDATVFAEITSRMRNLRRWLRELESRLCPVTSASSWSMDVLYDKYWKQIALQKEIESKASCVSVLLKLCERLKGNVRFGQSHLMKWDAEHVRKVASNLEHRFHALWINSLERQCIMEGILRDSKTGCEKLEKSFSEEPLKKYPRLSADSFEVIERLENELKSTMNAMSNKTLVNANSNQDIDHTNDIPSPVKGEALAKNDKAVMVGTTGIAELKAGNGKFEIIQDVGYSSETSAHLSTDDKQDNLSESPPGGTDFLVKEASGDNTVNNNPLVSLKTINALQEDCCLSTSKHTGSAFLSPNSPSGDGVSPVYLAPDKYPSVSLKTLNILQEERCFQTSLHNGGCKSVPENFYMVACIDCEELLEEEEVVGQSEIVATPKVHRSNLEKGRVKNLLKSIDREVNQAALKQNIDREVTSTQKKSRRKSSMSDCPRNVRPDDLWKKSARVCEWLDKCHSVASDDDLDGKIVVKSDWALKVVNSSCDASGECTTAESDSERSDVNNSVTFSQSFTGSIETVVPATTVTDPSPGVRLRKKRRSTRDRPWSVIELNGAKFTIASVPHSTSESALDKLCSSQDNTGKAMPKKLCPKNKRLSLTDISNLNYLSTRQPRGDAKSLDPTFKKIASTSDVSSDNCRTPLGTAKDSTDSSLKVDEKMTDVQILLSETNSLPETTLSVDTSLPATEDQASLSDQAWDEYQDPPYLSEPYSEQTVDEDEVRRLISFGDDYRATLGSYSDGSSVSLRPPKHHRRTRGSFSKSNGGDSCRAVSSDTNSDFEDFHDILKTSSNSLEFVKNSMKEGFSSTTKPAELVATCQTNLCHLKEISAARCELESVSKEDVLKLQDLIEEWESVQVKLFSKNGSQDQTTDVEAETVDVRSSLTNLGEQLAAMEEMAKGVLDTATSLQQIETNIHQLQSGLSQLQEMKECVLNVSARIFRLMAGGGGPTLSTLRESATLLYQQWEDVYELNCTQLTKLQALQSKWSRSAEEEMDDDLETTVQWHPVQVGNNLPTAEMSREALHLNTAAEVQLSDCHDILFEMEDASMENKPQHALEGKENALKKPLKSHTDSDPNKAVRSAPSGLWRLIRTALPFQLILLVLYCLSCMHLEPQCCENVNNFDFSMLPHLRYINGPPPV